MNNDVKGRCRLTSSTSWNLSVYIHMSTLFPNSGRSNCKLTISDRLRSRPSSRQIFLLCSPPLSTRISIRSPLRNLERFGRIPWLYREPCANLPLPLLQPYSEPREPRKRPRTWRRRFSGGVHIHCIFCTLLSPGTWTEACGGSTVTREPQASPHSCHGR